MRITKCLAILGRQHVGADTTKGRSRGTIRLSFSLVLISLLLTPQQDAFGESHRVLVQGNKKLAIVARDGSIEWEMPWGPIHDIHVLANRHIMTQKGSTVLVEIDPRRKHVVWSYDASKQNGNKNKQVEIHSFEPLPDGRILIAESGVGRLIEIDRQGALKKEIRLKLDQPHPHHDTRLVRKLTGGNYLVCHERDGAVREYDGKTGKVVWEYKVPLFGNARRDGNGPNAFGNQVFAAGAFARWQHSDRHRQWTRRLGGVSRKANRLEARATRVTRYRACLGNHA